MPASRVDSRTPKVRDNVLRLAGAATKMPVGSETWFLWLASAIAFHYESQSGKFTAIKERRQRGNGYWYAYRMAGNKPYHLYLGKAEALTPERLAAVAAILSEKIGTTEKGGERQ